MCFSEGIVVNQYSQIFVADCLNHRVMSWLEGHEEASIAVGGNEAGDQSNQLNGPSGLSFDSRGNLYVVDKENQRIQKFELMLH